MSSAEGSESTPHTVDTDRVTTETGPTGWRKIAAQPTELAPPAAEDLEVASLFSSSSRPRPPHSKKRSRPKKATAEALGLGADVAHDAGLALEHPTAAAAVHLAAFAPPGPEGTLRADCSDTLLPACKKGRMSPPAFASGLALALQRAQQPDAAQDEGVAALARTYLNPDVYHLSTGAVLQHPGLAAQALQIGCELAHPPAPVPAEHGEVVDQRTSSPSLTPLCGGGLLRRDPPQGHSQGASGSSPRRCSSRAPPTAITFSRARSCPQQGADAN